MLEKALDFVRKNKCKVYIVVISTAHKFATKRALIKIIQEKGFNLSSNLINDYFKFVIYDNHRRFDGIDSSRIFYDHFTLESI